MTTQERQQMREHRQRIEREEKDWLVARIHHSAHRTWLPPDECATCQRDAREKAALA